MKDINNINIYEGDLVLLTRKDINTFEYGIFYNNAIVTECSSYPNFISVYKIKDLTDREEKIRAKILDKISNIEHKKAARKELKFLSNREQKIGHSYCTLSGDILLYVGKCHIEKTRNKNNYSYLYSNDNQIVLDGYGYMCIGYVSYDIDYNISKESYLCRPALEDTLVKYSGNINVVNNKKRVLKQCSYVSPVISKNFVLYRVDSQGKMIAYDEVKIIK